MSKIKISQMPLATKVKEQDYIPIVQDGVNKKASAKDLKGTEILIQNTEPENKDAIWVDPSEKNKPDYNNLKNKPLINGHELTGNQTSSQLGIEIPTKLPTPNSLSFTGAVTGSWDGSTPLQVNVPQGGGSYTLPVATQEKLGGVKVAPYDETFTQPVSLNPLTEMLMVKEQGGGGGGGSSPTKPKLIVDYTTTLEDEKVISIRFSFSKYPELNMFNRFRIYVKAPNNDRNGPWCELYYKGKKLSKITNWKLFTFTLINHENCLYAYGKTAGNISSAISWEKEGYFPHFGEGMMLPQKAGTSEYLELKSYTNLFVEKTIIKIWGWNE